MKIINIVASGDLHQSVSFERLPELPDTNYRYNPENYHGAYILLSRGKATIYRSGKYIIYGLASLDEVDTSYREFLTLISPLIDPSLASPPEVRNIVGMDDFQIEIPLSRLVVALRMEQVEYEPEQFPGLIYRGDAGTALIFSSGKVILAGFKDLDSMEAFASRLKAKIKNVA
ncbi:MAG: transcription initiation factor TATA-box-binding protein [Euryarchaeota archaeon]|jgi:transcription initiation factor TFIID TATA-box-binding protein|nr:transcription initiation factor TATA-box-binding protein [Euryarchaeota archaeon]